MAITKVSRGLLNTGISDSSDATAITISSNENVLIGSTAEIASNIGLQVTGTDAAGFISLFRDDSSIVANDDLGGILFYGDDNSATTQFAYMRATAEGTHADGDNPTAIRFGTTADGTEAVTERMRILSGGGITFNGDTAAANALDDYEEGSWTPTIVGNTGASGQSYSIQYGTYTRIGNFVHMTFDVRLSTKGTLSGTYVNIGGHGFTFKGNNIGGTSLIGYSANTSYITDHPIVAYLNSTNVYLMYAGNGYVTTAGNFINDNTILIGTITGIIN